jgi:hypothetical protein
MPELEVVAPRAREHFPLKVTWNATTDAGTWVIINRPTGEIIGAVQVDGRSPHPGAPIRRYQVFGDQIGGPPADGTMSASVVDDAQVLAAWTSTLSSAA